MKSILLFIILSFIGIFVACDWRKANDCYKDYKFTIPFKLYPENDTFRIGDTIWLESVIPAMQYDSISEQEYSLGDFEHKVYIAFDRKDTSGQSSSGSDNFDFFNAVGTCLRFVTGNHSEFKLYYKRNNFGVDSLKAAFIPTQSGLYSFSAFANTIDYYTEKGIISKKCTETINMYYRTNTADSSNNYDLLIGFPNIIPTEAGFLSYGGYAFRVIE